MRFLIIFLVVLNFLYAGWQYLSPASQGQALKSLPPGLDHLQLLSEVDTATKQDDAAVVKVQEDAVKTELPVVNEKRCYTLGPFKDEVLVNQVKFVLSEQGIELDVRKRLEQERHRYWVYIPPLGSRSKAIAHSKLLAKKKVSDYYIIRSGGKNNGISLGHYQEKPYADRRVRKLKRLGFATELEVVFRAYDLFWLDYMMIAADQSGDKLTEEFLVEGVSRIDRACED